MPAPYNVDVDGLDVDLLYAVITLLCQTFFFGIFCVLVLLCVFIVIKRKKRPLPPRRRPYFLLCCVLVEFALAAAFWAVSVAILTLQFRATVMRPGPSEDTVRRLQDISCIGNAVMLVNYVITDGVLVHRARMLSQGPGGLPGGKWATRVYYRIPDVSLALTVVSVAATIVLRAIISGNNLRERSGHYPDAMRRALDCAQVAGLAFSLITNLSSMALIGMVAWRHRTEVAEHVQGATGPGQVQSVLAVLVDSGMLYISIGIKSVASAFIHLPRGTLGDIFAQAGAQLAGIYVAIVLVMVAVSQGELSAGDRAGGIAEISTQTVSRRHSGRSIATRGAEESGSQSRPDGGENGEDPSGSRIEHERLDMPVTVANLSDWSTPRVQ